MKFAQLLASRRPGDELKDWKAPLPVFFEHAGEIPAGPVPWHNGNMLEHLALCMNEVAGDPKAVWMAMAHDAGKLTTPRCLLPHHYGHELRGATLARIWAKQLGLDEFYADIGSLAARWHMRAGRYPILRPGKKLHLLELFPPIGMGAPFWKVIDADSHSAISALALDDWQKLQKS